MYCSRCGNEVADGLRFCPSCGQSTGAVRVDPAQQQVQYPDQQPAQQQVQNPGWQPAQQQVQYPDRQQAQQQVQYPAQQQVQYPDWQQAQQQVQYPAQQPGQLPLNPGNYYIDVKTKKKGASKKKLLPILIAVVLVAAIVAGIILYPRFRHVEGDVFSAAKSSAQKNSAESYVLDVLSAAHNTVFNSSSLTASISEDGETFFSGKIVFGKDLLSSECFASVEDGYYLACLQDGVLVCGEEDDPFWEINVADLAKEKDSILSTAVNEYENELDATQKDTVFNAYQGWLDAGFSIIKDKHIDYSVVKSLGASFISYLAHRIHSEDINYVAGFSILTMEAKIHAAFFSATEEDFEALYSAVAEFIATGADGAFKVEKSKSGGRTQYDIKVDLDVLLNALAEYASGNKTVRKLIGDTMAAELKESIKDEAEYYEGESLDISVSVDGKKLQSIKLGSEGDEWGIISISDIGSTKIDEMESVRRKASGFNTVRTAEDFVDFMDEF